MVQTIKVLLRAWSRRGDKVQPDEFLRRLSITPDDAVKIEAGGGVPRVILASVSQDDVAHVDVAEDAGARSEAFDALVRDRLTSAAAWLLRQPPVVFEDLRRAGRVTDVHVAGWIDDDQFTLDLPADFLRACGTLGLTLSICTND